MSELKQFAFEQNPGFCEGLENGFEIRKTFFHRDQIPPTLFARYGREFSASSFMFNAFRMDTSGPKGSYAYNLSARTERSLDHFPARLLPAIRPEILRRYKGFKNVGHYALQERLTLKLGLGDEDPDELTTNETYTLSYRGRKVYKQHSENVLYGEDGNFVKIPTAESNFPDTPVIWVSRGIEHEKTDDPIDGILWNTEFWDVVTPASETMLVDEFRSGANAARTILTALRDGVFEGS